MEFVYLEYCAHPKANARRHATRVLRARRVVQQRCVFDDDRQHFAGGRTSFWVSVATAFASKHGASCGVRAKFLNLREHGR